EQRLRGRGTESEDRVLARLSAAKAEMEYGQAAGNFNTDHQPPLASVMQPEDQQVDVSPINRHRNRVCVQASSKPTQAALSPDSATSAIESLDARCSRLHRNLFDFYVCVNRTNYLDMLKQFQRNVEESREFEVPIFATIISVYCLFILFGLFGNGMVILTVWRNRSMRNARNIFIVNLAVSDFILCLLTQPMNIMRLFPNFISWEFGRLLCKVVNTLTGLNMFVSTFSITAIALDRFQDRMSRHAMTLCLAAIWGSAGLMASPLALFADIQHHPINFGRDFNARVNKNLQRDHYQDICEVR
uniref:G_PROTEIN_RECEP_F1_2 domain-containing protein n=1 Tax=Macrostomum lignano TaxID=282301 RepID=A0A1I8FAR5_9PLAT